METHIEMMTFQKTLRNSISCTGVGVHSGNVVNMTLRPAEAGTGIVFRRTDVDAAIAGLFHDLA
jgi:UDP-3-O-[3-hydroxymyristoyl] N-acetylglucosamine deacetylase